ncbi:MAG: SDR family oxidoreductase [Vicinamibacterales bacterium]
MESVALDVKADGIDVNSIAPGALNTRMMDQLLEAGADAVGEAFYARMRKMADGGTTPLDVGAAGDYLGSAASDGITGRLLSAPWDPWETLHEHRADLDTSDVYTLRRIVPKDRGFGWGSDEPGRRHRGLRPDRPQARGGPAGWSARGVRGRRARARRGAGTRDAR